MRTAICLTGDSKRGGVRCGRGTRKTPGEGEEREQTRGEEGERERDTQRERERERGRETQRESRTGLRCRAAKRRKHLFVVQWVPHTSSVWQRRVRTPGGIETRRTSRNPLYARERERGRVTERESVG